MMMRSYDKAAAGLIQMARLKTGLSQAKLAERAGVPATMISAYERGRRQPTLPTLLRLLEAAGVEIRMHLAPFDPHDRVLEAAEAARAPEERALLDERQAAWRDALPVDAS